MKSLIIALRAFLFFTILTGIIYPLFVTGIAQVIFREKANGSLIMKDNETIGSSLIGQQFDNPIYFASRPSAIHYNPLPSGGSNYGVTNLKLKALVGERMNHFISMNKLDSLTVIPSEMLFASASGIDPHISPAAALLQMERVARARNFNINQKKELEKLIKNLTENPQFLCLGEERINVLIINLKLDDLK
jgi:potassium-transporting ATPase KdpC subunit